jgi:cytochrome bd ubiquinol oxidase subunit II
MLLAPIFRGVAFEFRCRDAEHWTFWDRAFNFGSVVGALPRASCSARSLTALRRMATISPAARSTVHAVLAAHRRRTRVRLQPARLGLADPENRRRASGLGAVARALVIRRRPDRDHGGELVEPFIRPEIAERWFFWPNTAILAPAPIITALIAWWEWRSLNNRSEAAPFIGAVCLFVMSYLGIAISLWPMIVPYKFTLWGAASPEATQAFLLVGTLFLLRSSSCTPGVLGVSRQGPRRSQLSLTGCSAPRNSRYSAGVAEPSAIGARALRARAFAFSGPSDRRCQSA